ncbi:la-related protein 7 [Cephus cinctus]|uniref:La-related protein 7 n=1 Tax=Cephus cinctus TaxID=211228 RepID=A0AAJ7FFZ0_CEPCN|nr:la-related protein 7 [Cephus cinctus]XP_015589918.1 la-related protein 7 [Cephus cinctus]XP_015589919.1 la-related protein 7 [Cephus cinctus]XP_024938123.1 la-related protein 7 [Cephus cinctus]XP_024938124.1 la-related protein 7 [Cephus cinctus]
MVTEEQQSDMELASELVPVPQVQNLLAPETVKQLANVTQRKPRHRKKALYAAILKQMEFYFGDANLSKDRFLGTLIKENPQVDLAIFLRFNKIRSLTDDITKIAKALQSSTMLSVSEDGTKVSRITPICQKENADECTVYVQGLPPDAAHDWLSNVFSQYGPIAYVSIPRYKSNKKIKGFAFVEFETVESADACLKAFRENGCELPSQTSPDDLLSITTFNEPEVAGETGKENIKIDVINDIEDAKKGVQLVETKPKENDILKKGKRKYEEFENIREDNIVETSEKDKDMESKKEKKRKRKNSPEVGNAEDLTKSEPDDEQIMTEEKHRKRKITISEDVKEGKHDLSAQNIEKFEDVTDSQKNKKSKKRKLKSTLDDASEIFRSCTENGRTSECDESAENAEQEEASKTQKKRKRKRKRHSKNENPETTEIGMQVMAKKDWKRLRNRYLELQRSKMKSLKQHLRRARWNQWNSYEKNKPDKEEVEEKGHLKVENTNQRFSYTPGVIVSIEMEEPCVDVQNFKMELKGNTNVRYIDVTEGSTQAFVRCDTADAAKALAQKTTKGRSLKILQDEDEKLYWEKMVRDREEKLSKKIRVKQRGRDKLLKKAEKELGKHIKFDEV